MILITGASSGIGEATARAFAARGRGLILLARRGERLEALARELRGVSGREVLTGALDLRDESAIDRFFVTNAEALRKVTVLVNNAGLARGMSAIQEGAPSDWKEMIDTNLTALLSVTRRMLPVFIEKREGHIVNLGSVAGRITYPKGNVYCATKAAVRSLNECLRLDLNGTGVRVTEIAPGMVETEFSEVRLGDSARAKAVYAGMTPLAAKDVADAILWCVERPPHVNVQELVLYPTDQASPTVVSRRS